MPAVFKMIVDKGSVDYFDFGSWLGFPYNSLDDDYEEEDYYSTPTLEENVRDFSEELYLYDNMDTFSGIWNGDDYDLSITRDLDGIVTIEAYGTYEELALQDLFSTFASMKDLTPGDSEKRIDDFYLVGEITSLYGTYSVYLEMDEDWIKAYEADPSSVTYHLYIAGSDADLDEISAINI